MNMSLWDASCHLEDYDIVAEPRDFHGYFKQAKSTKVTWHKDYIAQLQDSVQLPKLKENTIYVDTPCAWSNSFKYIFQKSSCFPLSLGRGRTNTVFWGTVNFHLSKITFENVFIAGPIL